ncbi:hypothetical protein ASPWEDRAFT_52065 [Aspergillus wentii DTO 134E9]|uniref:Condensation domain-containing protein n=1 Tax=Aspergillus wentii DTO 134E9 TaxID=1073089 RepID=A0A1L9RMV1_ASPWE|nr:uncharacterized protein ASPWEDRAFT_52065 [Aspergillus wentii DTO 134E9]OJJ36261.1 hypothetical protein ASPWEDRAFT_52065 [Aspergillus wentii DTO 134E9]
MPWHQVSPGHFERQFDSLEIFYRAIADAGAPLKRQHYLISSSVRLKQIPPPDQVKQTWKALRQQHPQIAALPDESGTRLTYTSPSPADLEAWADETFIVESVDSSGDHLYKTLQPSPLFKLYYLPGTRELLFRAPHWRIDGIGLMHLQAAFLRILANGPPADLQFDGSEAARLSPSFDEAASIPLEAGDSIYQAADAELDVFRNGLPSISIPTLPNALPTAPRRMISGFSAGTTQRIISACKAHGITVTTAAHAALVVATLPYAQVNFDPATRGCGGGKYTCFNAIDLRKYLPAPYSSSSTAVSIYHTGIPFSVDLSLNNTFTSMASVLAKGYSRNLSKDEPRNALQFQAEYVRKVLELLGAAPEDPLRAPAHPELSSIGVVNGYLQADYEGKASRHEVEDWWIAVEVINRLLCTNVWTWNGEMKLNVNWNEAFYDEDFVINFLDEWKMALVEGGLE